MASEIEQLPGLKGFLNLSSSPVLGTQLGNVGIIYYDIDEATWLGFVGSAAGVYTIPYVQLLNFAPLDVAWASPPTLIGVYVGCEVYGQAICDLDLLSTNFQSAN